MKVIIIILFLSFTINAQNVWYVDRDATGANTGRSWTDAWTSLDSSTWMGNQGVNWAIIGDGDTIYVSGGTDSTRYVPYPENFYTGVRREISEGETQETFNVPVIIAPAWQTGHNGEVYFTPKDDNTYSLFIISGVNNVKITGMNFIDTRTNATTKENGLIGIYGSNNTIENCYIYSRGLTTGVYLYGANHTFRNNFFDYEENDLDNDTDPIGTGGEGNFLVEGNTIIVRNNSPTTTSHRDMLQFGNLNDPFPSVEYTVRNNLIIVKGTSIGWNAVIYSSGSFAETCKWYIYNNIFVTADLGTSIGTFFMYQTPEEGTTFSENFFVWNNTIIINDPGSGLSRPFNMGHDNSTDTIMIKNNIVVMDDPVSLPFSHPTFAFKEYYRSVDYNAWFEYGGLSGDFSTGSGFGNWDFSQWQSEPTGGDVHSITGNSTAVIFANRYGENISDYYTETGRNLGTNIAEEYPLLAVKFPDIEYDILGNPRTGTWDMGALEFQDGAVDSLPNTFTFTDITNATRSTLYTSNGVTLAGFDSAYAYASGATYTINAGADLTGYTRVFPNDVLRVKLTSSANYSTGVSVTLTVGSRSDTYTVTTEAEPVIPSGNGRVLKDSTGKVIRDSTGKVIKK